MTFQNERQKMVVDQLQQRGIKDRAVLSAMASVPRESFVSEELQAAAYRDSPLPLEFEQTISQPYTVAFMCQKLLLKPTDVVLEVGTGSGYGAAVLSRIVSQVFTVERIPKLAEEARSRLQKLQFTNVDVLDGDGISGWPEAAPFDAICVTAAGEKLPPAYFDQLADGGRILIPLIQADHHQEMTRFTRRGEKLKQESLGPFRFVPLIGEYESRWTS